MCKSMDYYLKRLDGHDAQLVEAVGQAMDTSGATYAEIEWSAGSFHATLKMWSSGVGEKKVLDNTTVLRDVD